MILKIILKKDIRYPSLVIYETTKILQIRKLYARASIKLIHWNRIKLPPNPTIHYNIRTRAKSANKLFLPRVSKCMSQRCITFIGCKIYNLLPKDIRSTKSKPAFKHLVNEWLSSLPIQQINNTINI